MRQPVKVLPRLVERFRRLFPSFAVMVFNMREMAFLRLPLLVYHGKENTFCVRLWR